jgi:signal transduction histidine kinase
LKISDTGPGMPPEHISRIFDPFYTTKSASGGTGLGLSIARKIINNLGGTIDVFSGEGNGATFIITFSF